jgi:predicted PurR-regulated permease PerM
LNSVGATIKKHWQLITFIICLLIFVWLIWKFMSVILPFIIGLIIAYFLLPIVRWLEKHLPGGKKHPGIKRVLVIIVVYFVVLIIIAGVVFYLYTVISSSTSRLWQNLPQLISGIVAWVQNLMAAVRLDVPASMLEQYDQAIQSAGVSLVGALRSGLGQGVSLVTTSASLFLGFLSLPLIVFFMLKDWDNLRDGIFNSLPPWVSEHARNTACILERVLGRYIRGQFIMSIIIGTLVFIMLTILKIEFAPALAVWAALMENIPMLGVWLSIIAGVSIALATEPSKAIWLVIGYVAIQQIENNLLVPKIQGSVMKMNPIYIILVSVLGAYLAGLVGFIIAVPITATVIELLKYFKLSVRQKNLSEQGDPVTRYNIYDD